MIGSETRFHKSCLDVLHASSPKELLRQTVSFVQSYDLGTVGLSVITDHGSGISEFRTLTNAPEGYVSDFENLELAKLDPVSQHCKNSSMPIVWDQDFYVANGRGDFWEHQAAFGLKSGISLAMHLPRGRHFLIGVDSSQTSCGSAQRSREIATDLFTYTSYVQAAAFDLCLPYARAEGEAQLAKGEVEALRWSSDGMTDWEVGQKMGISATEAMLRLQRAMQKLGTASKYEAILKAIKLGLVTCA